MLTGKIAVVTGGSRGIGAAIVCKLASLGASVALIYAGNKEAADGVCERCKKEYGALVRSYQCDVSDHQAVKDAVALIKKDFGTVHILVNNAGITRDGLLAMMSPEQFETVLDTNLKGAFYMMRHCAGMLLKNREGCIINISSISGIVGNAGQCNYAASKAGLIGLTKSAAKELAPRGIRCNVVAPGFIATDMTENLKDHPLLSQIPLGRMGRPEDVAEAVAYLAEASYVTGQVLQIDGGIAM